MILVYYSCQKKNTKMIYLKPLKPADNPHACGAALGELGMRKPLYIPLRSTWFEPVIHMYVNLPNLTSTNVLQAHKGFNTKT